MEKTNDEEHSNDSYSNDEDEYDSQDYENDDDNNAKELTNAIATNPSKTSSDLGYDVTKALVEECWGEKNVSLALDLEKSRDEALKLRSELESFRSVLLSGMLENNNSNGNDGSSSSDCYSNIPIRDLLRIRLASASSETSASTSSTTDDKNETKSSIEFVQDIQKLERKLNLANNLNESLKSKCQMMEHEIMNEDQIMTEDESSTSTSSSTNNAILLKVKAFKRQISQMSSRIQKENSQRKTREKKIQSQIQKIEYLSDHIEKLMTLLKQEAIQKVKSLIREQKIQKRNDFLHSQNLLLLKRKDKCTFYNTELKENSQILEDQLRLMDEKYMELRMKLDWTRNYTEKEVRKKDDEIDRLKKMVQGADTANLVVKSMKKNKKK